MTHTGTNEIETERLLLRRFTLGDANEMFREWANYEAVTKYLSWQRHISLAETKAFLLKKVGEYERADAYFWALQHKEEGILIGSLSAKITDERAKTATVGYCLGERFWNLGFASEALRAVVDYMFYDVKINRVEACHSVNNPASGRVLQKAGMVREGFARQRYITGAGEYQDADLYGLVKQDYEKIREPEIGGFLDLGEINLTAYSLSLKCVEYYAGDQKKDHVPAYRFVITEKNSGMDFGEINLRLGFNDGLYYGGHIGYTVYEGFRNMGVATAACDIILALVRAHKFKKIIVTVDHRNTASRRVCEKTGGRLIRTARLPEWHELYTEGQRFVCIYEITP